MRILKNAKIYTLDEKNTVVSALAISGGRVLAVGSYEMILREFGNTASIEDLEGRSVLPGLTDAHVHFRQYAFSLQNIDCETDTLAECLRHVRERAAITPPGEWVLGHGWNQNEWPDCSNGIGGFPNADMLDEISTEHPIFLTAKSVHSAWANTKAMQLAGINAAAQDPEDGAYQRDSSGNPTGILLEGAMGTIRHIIPLADEQSTLDALLKAQKRLWSLGLTGLHDFDRRKCFIALQTLDGRSDLGLRIIKTIPVADLDYAVGVGLRTGFGSEHLRIGNVKAFADGALGPHTAAMFQPYEDDPDNHGMLLMDSEDVLEYGRLAAENGLGMTVHAIGDRANHEVINAYEGIRSFEKERNLPHHRHRIEHVQILHPDDFERMKQHDIIASMQPVHATSDITAADNFWGTRSKYAYAWQDLLDLNVKMAFGSDAPVDSPNPFWGIHAAVTRRRADGSPGPEGWYPAQKISRLDAIRGYTTGAAYAGGWENFLGALSPGFAADLIVLDIDPFSCEADAIRNLLPTKTMVDGEWVFER